MITILKTKYSETTPITQIIINRLNQIFSKNLKMEQFDHIERQHLKALCSYYGASIVQRIASDWLGIYITKELLIELTND